VYAYFATSTEISGSFGNEFLEWWSQRFAEHIQRQNLNLTTAPSWYAPN
jgi:hypothetical protein